MTSPDPPEEATSNQYNIRIDHTQGPVIGDYAKVVQHFHNYPPFIRLSRRQLVRCLVIGVGIGIVCTPPLESAQDTPTRSFSVSLRHTYFDTQTASLSTSVTGLASSPDGKNIASASLDTTMKVWNIEDNSVKTFTGHAAAVTSVAWSFDGKLIASGSDDTTVRIWDTQTNTCLLPPFSIFSNNTTDKSRYHVLSVIWSPDGKHIAAGGADADSALWVWDVLTRKLLYRKLTSGSVWSVVWSSTGKYIATGNAAEDILIYNAVSGDLLYSDKRDSIGAHPKLRIAWSHNEKFLAAGSDDATINTWAWNTNGNTPLQQLPSTYIGHTATVNCLDWSPDDKYLVSGSDDTTFCIWDARSMSSSFDKKPLYQSPINQGHGSVNAVVWLRDKSQHIAVGRQSGHIEIWQIQPN